MSRNSWLESVYDMADYYFWEPGHLYKMAIPGCTGKEFVDKVNRSVRRNEVPLNHCFNILMRVLPDSVNAAVLEQAHATKPIELHGECCFVNFMEEIGNVEDFIQPDAVLESSQSRVYVELKLGAKIDLKQITKYLYFHEEWNRRLGLNKEMILLILTSKGLRSSFKSTDRDKIFTDSGTNEIHSLGKFIQTYDTTQHGNGNGVDFNHLDEAVNALRGNVNLAHMTWLELADHLENRASGDLEKLIRDFVEDIRAR